jgi:hypothetical protein
MVNMEIYHHDDFLEFINYNARTNHLLYLVRNIDEVKYFPMIVAIFDRLKDRYRKFIPTLHYNFAIIYIECLLKVIDEKFIDEEEEAEFQKKSIIKKLALLKRYKNLYCVQKAEECTQCGDYTVYCKKCTGCLQSFCCRECYLDHFE